MQQVDEIREEGTSAASFSVGRILAEAREAQGMSVSDVAHRIKFAPKQIEWLEADDFVRLPEAAFVRGFVRSYARMLNLDPAALLAQLPSSHVQPVPAPEPKKVDIPLPTGTGMRAHNIFWLIGALVVALSIALFTRMHGSSPEQPAPNSKVKVQELVLPGSRLEDAAAVAAEPLAPQADVVQPVVQPAVQPQPVIEQPAPKVIVPAPVAPAPAVQAPAQPVVQTVPPPAPVLPSHPPAPVQPPVAQAVKPAPSPVQAQVAKPLLEPAHTHKHDEPRLSPMQQVAQLPGMQPLMNYKPSPKPQAEPAEPASASKSSRKKQAAQSAAAADGQKSEGGVSEHKLRLEFDEDAWAEVKDAAGNIMLSRMHTAGSLARVSGKGAMTVVVGNAKSVRLFDNGRKINLEKYTNAEVATVKLK